MYKRQARQGVGGSAQGAQGGSLPKVELPKAIPEDVKQVLTNWGGILSQLTGVTKTYLKMATRSLGPNGELMLVFDDKTAYEYVEQNRSDCQDALKAAAADRIGKELSLIHILKDQFSQTIDPILRMYNAAMCATTARLEIIEDEFK